MIFCYERYGDTSSAYNDTAFLWFDPSTSLRKETESFFEYKKNGGNYGVNTYLIYYPAYNEYCCIRNSIMPEKVRNIYDYGHGTIGTHEFYGDSLQMVQVLYGNRQALNKKKVKGTPFRQALRKPAVDMTGVTWFIRFTAETAARRLFHPCRPDPVSAVQRR
ncbi:MAG: hypothetical protein IKH27_12870 [Oscillospiraceae bacterium]|nr:hypothetical protein [Oscillospiraceae bacterium]